MKRRKESRIIPVLAINEDVKMAFKATADKSLKRRSDMRCCRRLGCLFLQLCCFFLLFEWIFPRRFFKRIRRLCFRFFFLRSFFQRLSSESNEKHPLRQNSVFESQVCPYRLDNRSSNCVVFCKANKSNLTSISLTLLAIILDISALLNQVEVVEVEHDIAKK